jgi:rubredoxin
MKVSAEPQEGERACSRCAKPLGPLWFTLEERWICRRCARKTAR